MKTSKRASQIPPSPIRKLVPFAEQAYRQGVVVHHLNIGQPDLPTPRPFFDAISRYKGSEIATSCAGAAQSPKDDVVLGYGHSAGLAELRCRMADYYQRLGFDITSEDITVTTGASEAILFALIAICDPGDEVLCFDPQYTNYISNAAQAAVTLVPVCCPPDRGYHLPDRAAIEERLTPRTRAILLCTPNNPTGVVLTEEEMALIADIAKERGLYVISDESYREFVYDGHRHASMLAHGALADQVVLIDSMSKRYSVCGARIGCLVTKNRDIGQAFLHQGQARLCPPSLEQAGCVALLDLGDDYFDGVKREYQARRDTVLTALATMPGVSAKTPEGAFYVMARLPVRDAEHFAIWLLTDFRRDGETVMLAPGAGFYATNGLGTDEVRIAYVIGGEPLKRAMACMREGLRAYAAAMG